MSDVARAILTSWTIEPWPLAISLIAVLIYWRGWRGLHRTMPRRFSRWRLASLIAGVATCWLAIASPIDPIASMLLQVHMLQHVMLMMVGPPLILLALPGIPMLRGLPASIRTDWLGPFLASPGFRSIIRVVTHPVVTLALFIVATWVWHYPAFYERALRSSFWHEVEHFTFITTALLFWWPVVQPWPSRSVWPRWAMLPYLLAADLQNTLFSAIFVFLGTPIYGAYAAAPELLGITTLHDQAAAGGVMWVAGSAAFLLPVGLIIKRLLQPRLSAVPALAGHGLHRPPVEISLPIQGGTLGSGWTPKPSRRRSDLLRLPMLGSALKSLRVRRTVQWTLLAIAAAIVVDGLLGPTLSPMNLAGVLPWTHWRGFVVIALLVAGNAFCWACPFMIPRELGKWLFRPVRRWPRHLRSKWLAVSLLLLYLWAYEAFSLWDSTWWTAWVVIGYFAAAFTIDALFRGAAFCRWVCPIGQFHFIESMASPRDVAVIDRSVCGTCRTRDCIRGGPGGRGCELDLYVPTKQGNIDCTWCMDCARACPHDNVGVLPRPLLRDVSSNPWRGGIGRLSKRPDLAALAAVLTFGAFANALGMVGPVLELEDRFSASIGAATPVLAATLVLVAVAVALPVLLLPLIVVATAAICRLREGVLQTTCRLAFTLVPIGFAMWVVHMLFHFLTSLGTIVPVSQRLANDVGLDFGPPAWVLACCLNVPTWLLPLELLLLDAGLVLTLIAAHRLARAATQRRPLLATAVLSLPGILLFAIGVWITLQPMQMRGTILP
ncbi:MAG: cytochrome c oxidase assembly protein [Phycisphaerales bacterium]|jgi:cytochrome c oxidase assembly factor CtaG/polyferredoxin|nr:cytochrome c oxidase assembly protein [Phycisphaerales bacterium]